MYNFICLFLTFFLVFYIWYLSTHQSWQPRLCTSDYA